MRGDEVALHEPPEAGELNPAELARMDEALRQERETFNQRKSQDERWFKLRVRIGYASIPFLSSIALFCMYVMLNWQTFPTTMVTGAASTLFVDVLGVVIGVWKTVLKGSSIAKLQPVTTFPRSFSTPQITDPPKRKGAGKSNRKLKLGADLGGDTPQGDG